MTRQIQFYDLQKLLKASRNPLVWTGFLDPFVMSVLNAKKADGWLPDCLPTTTPQTLPQDKLAVLGVS